jgi:hypothetical protein
MSAPSAFTMASASWASIKATPGKASAPFSGAGKSASLRFFPTAGLPCGPYRRQPGLRPAPDMHRLYTTGPATTATVDRSQGVEINGLDIPRRIINEPMGQSDFAPLVGAALAAHQLRERHGIAPHLAEVVARLAAMSSAPSTTAVHPQPAAIEMFRARAEARAHLYSIGEIDLHAAIDVLQEYAERHGLIAEYGQRCIQHVISGASRPVRAEEAS